VRLLPARSRPTIALLGAALLLTAACGDAPERETASTGSDSAVAAATATSVEDFGGFDALVEAAEAEGTLNVIALPPDWTNYAEVISTFEQTYDIEVNSAQPDASSQEEINAAEQLAGTDRAPDVFDLGPAVATANADMFAPYKVQTWDDVAEELKDPDGRYISDYGGLMSIGYDADSVPAPTSVMDLLKPEYRGKVALNGDPTQAGAAFAGVAMAALGNGGSADDIAPGIEFFRQLKAAGNFLPVDPTPATIASGQTPVVIDWDYTNAAQSQALAGQRNWEVVVPQEALVSSYYVQAINADAPHPAAARLWQEYLYSDVGQNLWLKGFGRPVREVAMVEAGTIDEAAYAKLPQVSGEAVTLTEEQTAAAAALLGAGWAEAIS